MVFALDETLDSLLKKIEANEAPISGELYNFDIDDIRNPIWPFLFAEFLRHYPNEFAMDNRSIAELGIFLAEWTESDERLARYAPQLKQSSWRYSNTDKRRQWNHAVASAVSTAIDYAVEYGNSNDKTRRVGVTRYYGNKGVVFVIKDEGLGPDLKSMSKEFLRVGYDKFDGDAQLAVMLSALGDSKMAASFNRQQNEAYLMYTLGSWKLESSS